MKVKEVADLAGISVRTLHHYDEIGLLTPDQTTESGYRIYSEANLETLQQILFFKEMGMTLKEIKELIDSPEFDRKDALELHRNMLLEKRRRLDRMLDMVENTIKHEKGEIQMAKEERFAGFDFSENPYEQEARKKWGDKAVEASNKKMAALKEKGKGELANAVNEVYRELADLRHLPPQSEEAQAAIGEWYKLLNKMGTYSLEAFKGLGQMYVLDERFTKNIDQFGEGLAQFMCDAMAVYADRRS